MKNKTNTRNYIHSLFQNISDTDREEWDTSIEENVIEYIVQWNIQYICIYEHMKDEVKTSEVIKKLKKVGKSIYVPLIVSETEMKLVDHTSREKYTWDIDAFIIPARAFTIEWQRLGRGKWYYDRFLSQKQYKNSKKIGICYTFQILTDIPTEKHDIPIDIIITNTWNIY